MSAGLAGELAPSKFEAIFCCGSRGTTASCGEFGVGSGGCSGTGVRDEGDEKECELLSALPARTATGAAAVAVSIVAAAAMAGNVTESGMAVTRGFIVVVEVAVAAAVAAAAAAAVVVVVVVAAAVAFAVAVAVVVVVVVVAVAVIGTVSAVAALVFACMRRLVRVVGTEGEGADGLRVLVSR